MAGVPPSAAASYVRALFDEHAEEFDARLVGRLRYRAPQLLADAVGRACEGAGRSPRFPAMLDLGCGTGLVGAAFRGEVDVLVGVDVSAGMIAQARAKRLYDRLVLAELMAFLQPAVEAPGPLPPGRCFDLITAADVFIYIPDIVPVVAAVAQRLAPDGLFAFTVETHAGPGVQLDASLRFAQGTATVQRALGNAGLTALILECASARHEGGAPAPGLVVVARSGPP